MILYNISIDMLYISHLCRLVILPLYATYINYNSFTIFLAFMFCPAPCIPVEVLHAPVVLSILLVDGSTVCVLKDIHCLQRGVSNSRSLLLLNSPSTLFFKDNDS